MEKIRLIHKVILRFDILQSQFIEQFPNKIFYYYPNKEDLPRFALKNKFNERIVIEKDLGSNVLWMDKLFFEKIKGYFNSLGLGLYFEDNESFLNFFQNYFLQFNESIGKEGFNPSSFGAGMQLKIADENTRLFWDSLME
ncbi:hypothetical protein [Flavobacterium aciduliphilum]|uniref:Uncharacterized protein n=1 Tax=Flavobacterium aciduliphilum TaxID=1101402 RepID=A0A328YKH6_9FLAO|nr:hypothetical protein [Flavobacterium aciduliphilum]RAR73814.1 hypothetical protein CLV55_103133 [Flavobacterium aciduliphilum]